LVSEAAIGIGNHCCCKPIGTGDDNEHQQLRGCGTPMHTTSSSNLNRRTEEQQNRRRTTTTKQQLPLNTQLIEQ
jgi:hypothetical protein